MKKIIPVLVLNFLFLSLLHTQSDPPELVSWFRNTTGLTGYNNLPANVQLVRYSTNNVYISCSGIPAYTIGPWPGDPNIPANQNFVFKLPRNPSANTGTKTSTPLGPIAVWVNGVPVFNALDAMSYQNQNIWHQNAVVVEASSFDACLGHPAPGGIYHHHQNPRCLYTADSTAHSPILGYAYDGFPIYGPYGFVNADGTGGIKRIKSSYRLRSITQRTTLPDGTVLSPAQYGPAVSGSYHLGYYVEDYEYVSGLGDLDRYNGRVAVTPEYPDSTYAYVVTINDDGSSAYPYAIGPSYYGAVATENISTHGHVTVTESVVTYNPVTSVDGRSQSEAAVRFQLSQNYPNPFNPMTTFEFSVPMESYVKLNVFNFLGEEIATLISQRLSPGTYQTRWDAGSVSGGVYFYRLQAGSFARTRKLILIK